MKIFLVTDQKKDEEYFKIYSNYALREDIFEIDYKNILTELETHLLQNQEHLDMIVFDVEEEIDFEIESNVLTDIRARNSEQTYSNQNFKLNNIPIIFIHKSYMTKRNGESCLNGFHCNVQYLRNTGDKISLQFSGLSNSIDTWLRNLSDDLDLLDIDTKFDFQSTNSRFNEERINDCKILSRSFLKRQAKLNYNWIGNKVGLLENGAQRLYDLIIQHERNPRFRNEKAIHEVFKDDNAFLLGEKYDRSIYEKQLYYPSSRSYIEIDFINISHTYYQTPMELYEVKLPNHSFVSKKGIVYNYTKKYFNQIGKKYKGYFADSQNNEQIKNKLNVEIINFSLSLLMGRKDDIDEYKDLITGELSNYSQSINLQSFDDVMEKYNFTYKRIKRFNIQ